jgi:TRAP-type mannitol/chloroaromatic compound transport system permease small subunit
MSNLARFLGIAFGWMTLALGLIVTSETAMRKFFNYSMQGADELGGYILAFTTLLSFCCALIGRNHMRIDTFHYMLSWRWQALLNWISIASIGLFAVVLAWASWGIIRDTWAYKSTAPTPWATPLIYPQAIWYVGIVAFALVAVALSLKATKLLVTGRLQQLADEFQPKAAKEELKEELEDAKRR